MRVRRLAAFTAALETDDVPAPVLDRARAQRRSVLAAVAGAAGHRPVAALRRTVAAGAPDGPAPLPGSGRRVAVGAAVYATAAASIALDHDDYACFAHPGHSAVLVPLLLAAETGASGRRQLAAQVAANEVACRLGGLCLLGPQNGQLWTHVHAAAAAVAAARLLGLDDARTAHALALALTQPPRALAPALAGADGKLLLAAEPAAAGLRAARLAAAGLTGPLDVLDHPRGLPGALAAAPLPGMLEGLGRGWATRTLSVKPTPGCAYLTAVVQAVGRLGEIDPDAVGAVDVDVPLPTRVMDGVTAGALLVPDTPVTVTFSTRWAVAVRLVAGRLTPEVLTAAWLDAHRPRLQALADRVRARHDPTLTAATARAFAGIVPLWRAARQAGLRGLLAAGRSARTAAGDGAALPAVARHLLAGDGPDVPRRWWDDERLAGFAMTLPARVTVRRRDGPDRSARVDVPAGAAGSRVESPAAAARAKLSAYGPDLWDDDRLRRIDAAVDDDADDLWARLAPSR